MIETLKKLYRGENRYRIIPRSRLWLTISSVAMLISLASLVFRGLNFGIDFRGGSQWTAPVAAEVTEGGVRDVLSEAGLSDADVQFVTEQGQRKVRVESRESNPAVVDRVKAELGRLAGSDPAGVAFTSVGPSFGGEVSRAAIKALLVFLVLFVIGASLRFEWKMAVAALAALFHDVLITAGVYSLSGFEVAPATVIATLTILGYSLYDGIVVFDKVQENTALAAQASRKTYGETVNDSLNQVLMRSLNTSITALIPVGSLLVVGMLTQSGGTLKDFALALFVGLAAGTYSSVFFASPILVLLKENEPQYKAIRSRLEARAGAGRPAAPVGAARRPVEAVTAAPEAVADVETEEERVAVAATPPLDKPRAVAAKKQPAKKPPAKRQPTKGRPQGRGGKRRR